MNEPSPPHGHLSRRERSEEGARERERSRREFWHAGDCFAESPPGRIDLALPHEGIVVREAAARRSRRGGASESPIAHLLGVACGTTLHRLTPSDHWIRGRDLTAVYEPADARRLRITATWRRQAEIDSPDDDPADDQRGRLWHRTAIWQLILSAQTALLESSPSISVVTRFPSGEVTREPGPAGRHGTLVTLPTKLGVLVAVHPIDLGVAAEMGLGDEGVADPHAADGQPIPAGPERVRIERVGESLSVTCRLFASPLEKGVLLRGRVLAAIGPAETQPSWAVDALKAFGEEPPPLNG
jgi:hypothetical protein